MFMPSGFVKNKLKSCKKRSFISKKMKEKNMKLAEQNIKIKMNGWVRL